MAQVQRHNNQIRTFVTESVNDLTWEAIGQLVQDTIYRAVQETEQQYRQGQARIVSTDTVLVEHRNERRFVVTVVLRVG